ncbi:MAG TPA: beta-ketoacyl-ACP synthase III [Polyangiaceae bacterium]|nr:beta-ketoacyl-ACP synthase III [Polyangiaceae bacterium]
MQGMKIVGSGRFLPGEPITNAALSRVMDTNDEWIQQRTGIAQRHYAEAGQGAADMAAEASRIALADAGLEPKDLDYILFNTMTPDHLFPGSGAVLGAKLGSTCPALDLRTQCAAFLFSLQVAQGLIQSGAARRILVVGAEAHAGFMPWRDWDLLRGRKQGKPSEADFLHATKHRGWSIIFGDGAGAVIFEATDDASLGLRSMDLHTDGRYAEQLWVPAGFRSLPYVSAETLDSDAHLPAMEGREVFKHAVTKLPKSVKLACEKAGVTLDQVDYFIAHQANQRINDAIAERLGLDAARVPSNIEKLGNTSGGTIPILLDEMRRDGRLKAGQTLCFLALGAGLHWGAGVVRI